jgi:hypothetical protein
VDVILVADAAMPAQRDRLINVVGQTPRLARAVMETIKADTVVDAAFFEAARKKSEAVPFDEAKAKEFALKSAELMGRLALSRGQVLDLAVAKPTLLAALDDARPEVVKAVGAVLAYLPGKDVQSAVLAKAGTAEAAVELRISLYKGLAINAKFFGNALDAGQTEQLRKVAEGEKDMAVRAAAAEAHGALNLPPEQVQTLIVNQSKI